MNADLLLSVLFVVGLILLAIGTNGGPSWTSKSGTIMMAVVGVVWLVAGHLH